MKRDPYKSKEKWENWKNKNQNIKGVSKDNSNIILRFLYDMEIGINTPPRSKGERSPVTLINLRDHLTFFAKHIKMSLTKLTKEQIHNFEKRVRDGKIRKKDGHNFEAFGNYIKDFKAFWGWLVRTGKVKENITIDLTRKEKKPAWVYLTETQFKKLANRCSPDYKALVWFMYDTGMRVTEAYSIQIKCFDNDLTELTIPEEVSKTFGRVIKLKLCINLLKEYIKYYDLKDNDYLFVKNPPAFNKYLRTLSKKLFGDRESKARETYDKFTLYDIRHNASCYWLKRYPNIKGLKYRMGWKREEQATYYHEFLGMSDEIRDEDLILAEDKGKLRKMEDENQELRSQFDLMKETFEKDIKDRKGYDDIANDLLSEKNIQKILLKSMLKKGLGKRLMEMQN